MNEKAHAQILVFTTPRSEADESAFDQWYDQVHIPQVVAVIPGVLAGRRYVQSQVQLGGDAPNTPRRRLTIYYVDPAHLADTVAALRAAMSDGTLVQSDLVDRSKSKPEVMVYSVS